ncbi:MAG: ATP cone domain-containing protein, partial [Candidatus Liptonbacteria bacterium]
MNTNTQTFKEVRKRDGRVVPFEQVRIANAVAKAMRAAEEGHPETDPQNVAEEVVRGLLKKFHVSYMPGIEEIQDVVETTLISLNFPKTAKAYILYRNERAKTRAKRRDVPERVRTLVEESKKYFRNPLGEFVYYRTYARWIEDEQRRETWIETVDRYVGFMRENLGNKLTEDEYQEVHDYVLTQRAMPSMRLMQFAGKAARSTNVCAYNCSFIAPSKLHDFSEIMYISMCGTGVGFSVESQNIQALPQIKYQTGEKLEVHVVPDSKEGWADALFHGLETWYGGNDVDFDFSELRPAGARLNTMGGKSSGPEPLRSLLAFARAKILRRQGRRLTNLDAHDIICKIGEIVVSGGVRRSALISLSDLDDVELRDAKKGQFYLTEPQRSIANNSAVYTEKPSSAEFL